MPVRNLLPRLVLLALTASACSRFEAQTSFEQSIPVTGTVDLSIETGSGQISVEAGDDTSVQVSATVKVYAASEADAQAVADQIQTAPPVTIDGNTIHLGDLTPYAITAPDTDVSFHFTVKTPKDTTLTMSTSSGDQQVSGLTGPVTADMGSGDAEISEIEQKVTVSAGSGDTEITDCVDASVDVGSGDVSLTRLSGTMALSFGSGNITLTDITGSVTADGGSGNITASSGLSTGAVWKLEVASGYISLNLPGDEDFYISAATDSGTIVNLFPTIYTGSQNAHELTGEIGTDPDATVTLITASGDISLLPQ